MPKRREKALAHDDDGDEGDVRTHAARCTLITKRAVDRQSQIAGARRTMHDAQRASQQATGEEANTKGEGRRQKTDGRKDDGKEK